MIAVGCGSTECDLSNELLGKSILQLRREISETSRSDSSSLRERKENTIAPALREALSELKKRARMQGIEGKRYTKEFMEGQKPLVDYIRWLHKHYQAAGEKIGKTSVTGEVHHGRWDEETLALKKTRLEKVVNGAKPDLLVEFRAKTLAPSLIRAQKELMRRAHAQGIEGKKFTLDFMAENKPLIDHILDLSKLHRDAREKISDEKSLKLVVDNKSTGKQGSGVPSFGRALRRVAIFTAAIVTSMLGGNNQSKEALASPEHTGRESRPMVQEIASRISPTIAIRFNGEASLLVPRLVFAPEPRVRPNIGLTCD